MFGIDWNNDGKEDLLDDMITLELLDDDENAVSGGHDNSCLLFFILMGLMVISPVVLILQLL